MDVNNLIPKELQGYVYISETAGLCAKGKLPERLVKVFKETKEKIDSKLIKNK